MSKLNSFTSITTESVIKASSEFGTPFYLYDEQFLIDKCKFLLSLPNAYGLNVRYAMKANSNKSILKIITENGLSIDASSLNEVRRANLAGIDFNKIILTSQEVCYGDDLEDLKNMMLKGLLFNVCSLRQLKQIGDFASLNKINLSIRVHPGIGTGESKSRNTGDDYCCFGVHLSDLEEAISYTNEKGIKFTQVHEHIGSGGDPDVWKENIDLQLSFVEKYFKDCTRVSFGGGFKEARVPNEKKADVHNLVGVCVKESIEAFFERTGRKLEVEIEPGTFITANSGYIVTSVLDKKQTGDNGLKFIVTNGGMEMNARVLMYGSLHPIYIVSSEGKVLSSEFHEELSKDLECETIVVGRCCETGDSMCLNIKGDNVPRRIAEPAFDDYVLIGGAGAYCSSMAPFNYNSYLQAAEVLYKATGELKLIRKRQTMEQMITNEI